MVALCTLWLKFACGQVSSPRLQRLIYLSGHHGIINAVHPARRGEPLIASASDDCTIKIWDTRRKGAIDDLKSE